MKFNFISSSSILKKFLVINLIIFLILGVFTLLYLNAIKPNLIKNRSNQDSAVNLPRANPADCLAGFS